MRFKVAASIIILCLSCSKNDTMDHSTKVRTITVSGDGEVESDSAKAKVSKESFSDDVGDVTLSIEEKTDPRNSSQSGKFINAVTIGAIDEKGNTLGSDSLTGGIVVSIFYEGPLDEARLVVAKTVGGEIVATISGNQLNYSFANGRSEVKFTVTDVEAVYVLLEIDVGSVIVVNSEDPTTEENAKSIPVDSQAPWLDLTGLELYFDLDAGGSCGSACGGKDVEDGSGKESHGDQVSAFTFGVTGVVDKAIEFDGITGQINFSGGPGLDSDSSYGAWFKTENSSTAASQPATLIGNRDPASSNGAGIVLGVEDGKIIFEVDEDGSDCPAESPWCSGVPCNNGSVQITGPQVDDGEWHHVVVTVDATAREATLYLDGFSVESKSIAGIESIGCRLNPIAHIGQSNYGTQFHGLLDEIILFSRVLTAQEINQIYSTQSP